MHAGCLSRWSDCSQHDLIPINVMRNCCLHGHVWFSTWIIRPARRLCFYCCLSVCLSVNSCAQIVVKTWDTRRMSCLCTVTSGFSQNKPSADRVRGENVLTFITCSVMLRREEESNVRLQRVTLEQHTAENSHSAIRNKPLKWFWLSRLSLWQRSGRCVTMFVCGRISPSCSDVPVAGRKGQRPARPTDIV